MTRLQLLAIVTLGAGTNVVPSPMTARAACHADAPSLPPGTGLASVDTIAFVNVNVVPLDREDLLKNQSVLVHDGRIVSIGPASDHGIADRVTSIDGEGRYLIPGLFDMHSHLLSDDRIADEHAEAELAVNLANGITSIRIPIGKPEHLEYRKRITADEMIGPTLHVGSPQLAGQAFGAVFNGREVTTAEEARQAVRDFYTEGYDFIKLTFFISEEVYDAVIETAAELGIRVVGHVGPQVRLRRALLAGQQIEHLDQYLEALLPEEAPTRNSLSGIGIWQRPNWESLEHIDESKIADLAQATAEAGVWNTPTLAFLNSSFGTGRSDREIEQSPDYRFVSTEVREELLRGRGVFWSNPPPEQQRLRYVDLRNWLTRAL